MKRTTRPNDVSYELLLFRGYFFQFLNYLTAVTDAQRPAFDEQPCKDKKDMFECFFEITVNWACEEKPFEMMELCRYSCGFCKQIHYLCDKKKGNKNISK